jgi:4'-phosphopantetheinyl transferase
MPTKVRLVSEAAALCEGSAHVWWMPPDEFLSLGPAGASTLNSLERDRADRFRLEEARLQFMAARILLRACLAAYGDLPPADWRFVTNQYGRPELKENSLQLPLYFNVSHTNGAVGCVISRSAEIGLDIESWSRDTDFVSLAPTVLAPLEREQLAAAGGGESAARCFFTFWTLKEAYIKARGLGLSIPLQSFWFRIQGLAPLIEFSLNFDDQSSRWRFWRSDLTHSHLVAVASSSERLDVTSRRAHLTRDGRLITTLDKGLHS